MFTDQAVRALILSLIAGMSTLLGAIVIFVTKGESKKLLAASLGFAGGIMVSVSFGDLFPVSQSYLQEATGDKLGVFLSVIFLSLGILIAASLDRFVPHQNYDESTGGTPHNNLFKVGFVSMLAIALHNFPEGIATFMAGYDSLEFGISITIAIAMHNIPEGISVAMPIYYSTGSRKKALKYTIISGITEPLGAILAFAFLRPFINGTMMGIIFAIVAGIMIYIAIEELLPSSRQYGYNRHALIATFLGICIMPLSHVI